MNPAGRGRVRSISSYQVDRLRDGWELASCPPGAVDGPTRLDRAPLDWISTLVPSTAASSLQQAGRWSLDGPPRRFDAEDWWYRTTFTVEQVRPGEQLWLCCEGLATVADVWLNDEPLFCSSGMFTAHEHRIDHRLHPENRLTIRFHALDSLLAARRPRPRWRAPMVENQQLRWYRTTLLGRTPGWSPPAAAVGPWRPVWLERRRGVSVDQVSLEAYGDGLLEVSCRAATLDGSALSSAEVIVDRRGESVARFDLKASGDRLNGRLVLPRVEQWWPHTHGDPHLYSVRLQLGHSAGPISIDVGEVGFRTVSLETSGGDFRIQVNGAPVFCRGACWTPVDPIALSAGDTAYEKAIGQVVAAGMNMLRVGGTMVYENDRFLDLCDSRGVLLWQDFMFANMDYPEDDPAFSKTVEHEVRQQLARLQGRPSLAVLCGNSEGGQQAAMWGATRDRWEPTLFHTRIAGLAAELCPNIPYAPSSAHGGAFPHQGSSGSTSYYGVGAYRRPLEDARRAEVRFASECLAFANVGRDHDPARDGRTPRDLGASWDFADVRDHYLALLFGVDPATLRQNDLERYHSLSRVVTGEVMAHVFGEWRRRRSATRGGLIWYLRDLWNCDGWGVIDASGNPKPAWYYLRRALAPVALFLSDEGSNGIGVHLTNDSVDTLTADLEIVLYRGAVRIDHGVRRVSIPARGAIERNAAEWFDGLHDLSYAYRFGPPAFDVMAATLRHASGAIVARGYHFIPGLPTGVSTEVGLSAEIRRDKGAWQLVVRTRDFAQAIDVALDGYTASDSFFHLAPGEERVLALEPDGTGAAEPRGVLRPLNAEQATPVTVVHER